MRKERSVFLLSVLFLFLVYACALPVYASSTQPVSLKDGMKDALKDKTYQTTAGTTITGADLWQLNANPTSADYGTLDTTLSSQLTTAAMEQAVEDANAVLSANVESNSTLDDSYNTWLQNVQSTSGLGAVFISSLTSDIQPDLVGANHVLKPIMPTFNLIVGIVVKLLMWGVVLKMVLDISYICLPVVQSFFTDNAGPGSLPSDPPKTGQSFKHMISHQAAAAVRTVEGAGKDGKKSALGAYFTSAVTEYILIGICLFYLAAGHINTLVGWFLNFLNGFLS